RDPQHCKKKVPHRFTEDVIEYLQDTVSREDLQLLLNEEAWKSLVAEADLSREEADALYEALHKLKGNTTLEDKATLQGHMLDRERFLEVFPQVRGELEAHIEKLHALADRVDKVHKDCTISNVVANSTGAVSGILTILGLALAPVTAGVSLALAATGVGLGTAATVTTVSTIIVEHSNTLSAQAEASGLLSTSSDRMKVVREVVGFGASRAFSLTKNFLQVLEDIGKHIRAIKLAKTNSRLLANAQRLMTTGRVSVRSAKQVQKAFGGTALAMTKGTRLMGAATAGFFLLMDVVSLVQDSKHLHEGAKAESAQELRQKARELEQKLQELLQTHERLDAGSMRSILLF
uniref:Apolipoprotein L3 n=1 Tax=Sciurus vulgaris TaxID=55149 RepID=A0A8D2D935_SCIVU